MPDDGLAERAIRELAANMRYSPPALEDWERFYIFVATTHHCQNKWSATDVAQRLLRLGVPQERAEELGELYGHGRATLYMAGKGRHKNDKTGWTCFLG